MFLLFFQHILFIFYHIAVPPEELKALLRQEFRTATINQLRSIPDTINIQLKQVGKSSKIAV